MATRKTPAKRTRRPAKLDYEVTATGEHMRPVVVRVEAPNSASARREARKQFKESKPNKNLEEVKFSARRKDH